MALHGAPRTCSRRRDHLGALLALAPLLMGADRGEIVELAPDVIVTESPRITVRIRAEDGRSVAGEVELFVDGRSVGIRPADLEGASFAELGLGPGAHVISGSTRRAAEGATVTGEIAPQRLELRPELLPSARQEVRFEFFPIAEQRLREIALGTLTGPLSEAELDTFVLRVKEITAREFRALYAPFDVVLVDAPSPDADGAVTVHFEDVDPVLNVLGTAIAAPSIDPVNLFGAIPDYGNLRKTQTVRVMVGTFKKWMLEGDAFLTYTAAERADSLELRARDLGVALGRTAVHEVAHTLGLVAQEDLIEEVSANNGADPSFGRAMAEQLGIAFPLADLGGCHEAHSCPAFDAENPLADRFGEGYYVMDAGELTPFHAYFGFARPDSRVERLPRFSNFSASYLSAIHPKR